MLDGRAAPSARRHASCRSRSEEHTSELQSQSNLVCRLLLEKKKKLVCDIRSATRWVYNRGFIIYSDHNRSTAFVRTTKYNLCKASQVATWQYHTLDYSAPYV